MNILGKVVASVTVGNVQRIHKRNDRFEARHFVVIVFVLDNWYLAKDVRGLINDLITVNSVNPIGCVNRTPCNTGVYVKRVGDSHALFAVSVIRIHAVGVKRIQNNKVEGSNLILVLIFLGIRKHITQSCDFKVMCKLNVFPMLVLFPTHLVERGNSLVILFLVSLTEIISRSLDKHDWRAKFVSDFEICDEFGVICTSFDVNLRPYLFDSIKNRLIATLILYEVFHLITVLQMLNHRLFQSCKKIAVDREINRVNVDSLTPLEERRHGIAHSTILFFVGFCVSHSNNLLGKLILPIN